MSEVIYYDEVEKVKYYARCIRAYCKEHRCATCPFYINDKCTFLKDSPDNWKGIGNNENNDKNTV